MAWEQLAIDKPHLAYIIIGGFTSLFMLCSLFVKEKLYIGEATVATIVGVIFGPHAANLFNPLEWGNTDKIALECSRIVLVVQCFAVGVELPKAYMERHWRSVALLLIPVMTFGWLITSLFIWWMIVPLTWLESLAVAACVTATDPVLASSVVGKGKFAKRVPKHLRDVLSAESGCNDGMAFPFIYLSVNLIHYHLHARDTVFHWVCFTILYECVFGAVYGFLVGYIGRHAIKFADGKGLIDRESFLVFYFVLALFCAGSGSLLGMDDLLVGFAAGVGFSNDGWFSEKTEESHVSNVIDLLLNLAYFVFLGAIIPWEQYNNAALGMVPWKLVVISIMVIFFRRIPALLALKPLIPDVKNWREALFAGHFGPIGVGAIFAALLTRAELEAHSTQPLPINELPKPGEENFLVVQLIWPITTFLVITSILVHGSSIAVFTLGKRINTLSLTMSYTQGGDQSWMNRLPRIASTSRTSMSKSRADFESTDVSEEKLPQMPPGTLPPIGFPGNFLRRQRDEDNPSRSNSRASSLRPKRRKKWDSGIGPGGPISQSAIEPQTRKSDAVTSPDASDERSDSPDRIEPVESPAEREKEKEGKLEGAPKQPEVEIYEEGDNLIVEDEEGNVIAHKDVQHMNKEERAAYVEEKRSELAKDDSGEYAKDKHHPHEKNEGEEMEEKIKDTVAEGVDHPTHSYKHFAKKLSTWDGWKRKEPQPKPPPERKRGPAHAYQYGNTIIVEDEDGEVVKKYDLPDRKKSRAPEGTSNQPLRQGIRRMSTWAGLGNQDTATEAEAGGAEGSGVNKGKRTKPVEEDPDDQHIRFTLGGSSRRMTKQDFIAQIQQLDPKAQISVIEESDAPEQVKHKARKEAVQSVKSPASNTGQSSKARTEADNASETSQTKVPSHAFAETLSRYSVGLPETAAQRRRRLASRRDSDDDGTERVPPSRGRGRYDEDDLMSPKSSAPRGRNADDVETEAEKRRRLAALGQDSGEESDSDEDGGERVPKKGHEPVAEPVQHRPGIRFAETPAISQSRVQWGDDVKGKGSSKKK